jgi:hypothetical protein
MGRIKADKANLPSPVKRNPLLALPDKGKSPLSPLQERGGREAASVEWLRGGREAASVEWLQGGT